MAFFDLFRKKETETELMQQYLELHKRGRHTEAANCSRKLAEMGNAQGMLQYAMYLEECSKYTEAANWARKLAEMGDARGMYLYATYLRDGNGVQKDMQQCMVWLQKSADAGYAAAQKALAICKNNEAVLQLKQGLKLGESGKYAEAASCYKYAAEMGDARGMCMYANYLRTGKGVQKDIQRSIVWYQKSADAGYDVAQKALASIYYNGLGVEKDVKKGFKLMKKAAESGNVGAQREFGLMHLDGVLYGDETLKAEGANVAEALEWFEKAGSQGDVEAQYQMGFVLGLGADGDPKLMRESYEWLAKAADQGHQKAIKMCEDIIAICEEE